MRLTWKIRRKPRCLLYLTLLLCVFCLLLLLLRPPPFHWYRVRTERNSGSLRKQRSGGRSSNYMTLSDMSAQIESAITTTSSSSNSDSFRCTMGTCFDISRCLNDFKVFIYPPDPGEKPSSAYKKFLNVLRSSAYYTENPDSACLLILNLDTLDRDTLSRDFVRHLPGKLTKLPHWNGGRNHLIFNFYSGSFPDYSDEIDFPYGQAIIAKASFSFHWYRSGFDISLPLLHKEHRERGRYRGDVHVKGNLFPIRRKYLLVFKGKRYLWGLGSETRNALHHLNNDADVIMLTTCKHGKFWDKHRDERCTEDNLLYEKYDYNHLITNSTFCLVPRGRRLGSFRFLESLRSGCIPVSLSNGFVLPFQEAIDWSKALLNFDERQLFQIPYLLRQVSNDKILSMRLKTQFYWEQYFSSVEKVVHTTLEIIRNRIRQAHGHFIWNHFPGALSSSVYYSQQLHSYPYYTQTTSRKFTAVVLATQPAPKGNSPLVLLLKNLCNSTHLGKVVVSWIGPGAPKVSLPPHCSAPIVIRDKRKERKYFSQVLLPLTDISTDAVLSLWENTDLMTDEIEFGFFTWLSNPDRHIGYVAQRHYWSPSLRQWKYSSILTNRYSLVSLGASFYHRYYAHHIRNRLPSDVRKIADGSRDCFDIGFNFVVSDLTGRPPLKVTQRLSLQHPPVSLDKSRISACSLCLDTLANAYGYVPLEYSWVRADPVLFKDNVSALRKEFRRLESIE